MRDRCRREDSKRSKPAARENRAGRGSAQPILALPLAAFLLASLLGSTSRVLAAEAPKPSRPSLRSDAIELLENKMWDLVNQDRLDPDTRAETGGQALALEWDDRLAEVAREHSLDMATRGYFNHVCRPTGQRPTCA